MKRFTVKHGQYEIKKYGCDYCGEAKEVKGYTFVTKQFNHIYLCKDCWQIMKGGE